MLRREEMKTNYRIRRRQIEQLSRDQVRRELIKAIWNDAELEAEAIGALWAVLSPGQRALFAVTLLESEVNNGGIHQFFYNSSGVLAQEALDGFALFDARGYVELLRKACALFPGGSVPKDRQQRQRVLEAVSQETTEVLFDTPFYKLCEDSVSGIDRQTLKYLAAHPADFFISDDGADELEAAERQQREERLREMLTRDYRVTRSLYRPQEWIETILDPAFADNYSVAHKAGYSSVRALLDRLTQGQKAAALIQLLGHSLSLGGVYNFLLYNGDLFADLLACLRSVGANEHARLLEDVWRQFPEKPDQHDVKERHKAIRSLKLSQRDEICDACDESLELLNRNKDEALESILTAYVAVHPNEFFKD